MDFIKRRPLARNSVASGSVWEIRMKSDAVNGGIKVFSGEENSEGDVGEDKGLQFYTRVKRNHNDGTSGKRRTWNDRNPSQIRKTKSELKRLSDEASRKELDVSVSFNSPRKFMTDDEGIDADGEYEREDEVGNLEIEVEKKIYDDKEVNFGGQKPKEIEEETKKVLQIHEKPIPISVNVNKKVVNEEKKPRKFVNEEKKVHHQNREKPKHIFARVNNKQQSPVRFPPLIDPSLRKPPPVASSASASASKVFDSTPETSHKLQSMVDLVMWRDVSKSAFAFGGGMFFLLLSSFIGELNFSLISGISYLGLVYIAANFLSKSILFRGNIGVDISNKDCKVEEEEAIRLLKRILPYLNEFLVNLKDLLSGDPASTMKLAVLLFVLARYGSSITIWEMAKLGFFAAFTVPKFWSCYGSQLTAHGKLWIGRSRNAWRSCTHKEAVGTTVFIITWYFSSAVVRIWAVFMLIVAVRYYQQSLSSEDCLDKENRERKDSR